MAISHGELIKYLYAMDKEMHQELLDNLLFTRFMGKAKIDDILLRNGQHKYESVPSGKIVERLNGFRTSKTDYLQIPMELQLTQEPKHGDTYLPGTGESLENAFMRCFINQTSGVGTAKEGNMARLRNEQVLRHYERAKKALLVLMARWINSHFVSALYDGHSWNVTDGITNAPNGIGVSAAFHPNFYYNKVSATDGSGAITVVGTEKKNKTAAEIEAKLETDYGNMTVISPYFWDKLQEKLEYLHIDKGAEYEGKKYFLAIISREDFNAMKRHEVFRKTYREAFSGKGYEGPIFNPDAIIWGEYLMVIDRLATRKWYNTGLNFYGPNGYTGWAQADSGKDNNIISILGPSALGFGVDAENELHFEDEVSNFKQIKEIAGMLISGCARGEFVDADDIANYYHTKNAARTWLSSAYSVTNQTSLQAAVKNS